MKVNSMMFKVVAAVALMTSLARNPAFGAAGDCQSRAESLKPYQAVTLVDEWDPEWKGTTGAGVHYYKITLYRYSECTVWITGGNVETVMLDVNTDWESETTAWFEPPREGTVPEDMQVLCLYSDSWSEDDPAKDVFYVCVSGEIGEKTSLYYTPGIKSFSVPGTYDNPLKLTVTDATQTDQRNCIEGEFYYTFRLEADRKYSIRTKDGTAAAPLDLVYDSDLEPVELDPAYTNDANNASYFFYPAETKDYTFYVSSVSNYVNQSFKLKYRAFPRRTPKQHSAVWDETNVLSDKNGYSVKMVPGRLVGDTNFYDPVIDESLACVKLTAGDRMVFETSCDEALLRELMMRVYDSSGTVLVENTTLGRGSRNVRAAIEAPADGKYYVGVCVKGLEYWEPRPAEPEVTLFARYAEDFTGPNDSDAWDPGDDEYAGASLLTAVPATNVSEVIAVSSHGPHVLSGGDWYDWFAIPCRKGQSYALKAAFDSDETTDLSLKAKVYCLENGSLKKFSDVKGSLSPEGRSSDTGMPLVFTADHNGMFYVRVNVAEGVGLDYPNYVMRAISYRNDGAGLGLLRVRTEGVDTTWYLKDDAAAPYLNGAVVALPAAEKYKVKYTDVNPGNYVVPGQETVSIDAWSATSNVTDAVGRYWDVFDKKDIPDDTPEGYVSLTPVKESAKAKRTLWKDDPADYFLFKAKAGIYYNFTLVDTTEDLTVAGNPGNAVFSIIEKTTGEFLASNVTACLKRAFNPAKYYLKVGHEGDEKTDSCYRLLYSAATVGTVSFASTDVKVSDDAPYVDVTLNRSASDGAVRVNFATVAGTAVPGTNYYPTSGIVAWADGDMEPKTIRVRLIPDLVAQWEKERTFTVKIWPMAEDCLEEDEYLTTIIDGEEATVTIKESAPQDPGLVTLTVESAEVEGGDDVTFRIRRTGAANGRVVIQTKTQDGTAVSGVDYQKFKENLVWEDGDNTNEYVRTIWTKADPTVASRQFNFKLVPQTAGEYEGCLVPKLTENKVYVSIVTPAKLKLADMMKKSAAGGVAMTQKSGNWYVDPAGDYRCDPIAAGDNTKAKFALTGPGFFITKPAIVGGSGQLRYDDGAGHAKYIEDFSEPAVLYIGEGAHVVNCKLKNTDGNAYLTYEPFESGLPYKWIPLDGFAPVAPLDRSTVANMTKLEWSAPEGLVKSDGIWWRLHIGTKTSPENLAKKTAPFDPTQEFSFDLPQEYAQPGSTWRWMLEFAYVGPSGDPDDPTLEWVLPTTVWSYSVLADGAPKTTFAPGGVDVNGDPLTVGEAVELVEGVATQFKMTGEDSETTSLALIGGALPPGLALKSDTCKIKGTPTKAGDYSVMLQTFNGQKAGTTLVVDFHVAAMGTAAGSYTGALVEDGTALTNGYPRVGKLTVTTASDGTISAKAKIAGVSYKFTGDGFDGIENRDDSAAGQTLQYVVRLENVAADGVKSVLDLTLGAGSPTNKVAMGELVGSATLTIDGVRFGVPGEVVYRSELVRSCADSEVHRKAMSGFAGYYTVALVPEGVSPVMGVPCGNGYLTLTVDASGSVLAAGRLADGTEVSFSTVGQLRGDLANPSTCALVVPVGIYADPYSFGGDLRIRNDGGNAVVDSLSALEWNKDGKYSSYDRLGFRIAICPTGGWYNDTYTLQTYYLNRDFTVEAAPVDGLPEELLPAGYDYTVDTMPHDVEMKIEVNTMTPATRQLVAREDKPELMDLARSVNPWKVKLSFVRETGIVTGTFKAISDGETQPTIGTYQHYGILPMYRDANTPLEANVLTAGFYLMPVTSKWTFSLPFNINFTEYQERDWSESVVPVEE